MNHLSFTIHVGKQKNYCIFILAIQLLVVIKIASFFSIPSVYASEPLPKKVLLLNSYHQSMIWEEEIYRAIKDVLKPGEIIQLHVENMDTKSIPYEAEYEKQLYEIYKYKFQNLKFSLIISSDNNAFDFLRKYHDDLFPEVPVVFCGVNFFQDEQIADYPWFTGVVEMFDAPATLEAALQLHPNTKEVLVINDFLPSGKAWRATIREELQKYRNRLNIRFVNDWNIEELLTQVRQLNQNSIVLLGVYFRDNKGRFFTPKESTRLITQASKTPVYGLLAYQLGDGVVGGNLSSGYYQGEAAAKIAQRILNGESVKKIPVLKKGANRFMFDYHQLQRFGLESAKLPATSIIINQPYSFYEEHKTLVWIVTTFISLLTIIIILLLINIIKRKQTEKALQQAHESLAYNFELVAQQNKELERMDKLKDEFLANTSHELRTPLNGIIGLADSLIDGVAGQLPPAAVKNLSMIVASGQRLAALVDDILDFSKLKQQDIQLQLKPVGLREITDIVLTLSQVLKGQKKLTLINAISADLPSAYADENRLQQILYNLIGNALKFTERGTIEISANLVNSQLAITVSDTGIGIPADKIVRIFEAFEQAEGSTARIYGGTGLGLTVTKQLVELHGGKIWVESTVGIGSQFTFALPISEKPAESLNTRHSASIEIPQSVEIEPVPLTPDSEQFCILIVDDEPINLQVLINHLSLNHYLIKQASSGQEAITLIEEGLKPDLVLLDVMMPKMTGYEVTKKLRDKWPLTELPILLLTAKNQVEDLVVGLEIGANDYLTKPISKDELLARIKTHLSIKHLREENLRMSAELEVSRQLQQMLLPTKKELQQIEGLDIAGFMEPAEEVGGDYYDVLQYSGRILFAIGDVTGHGLESGALIIMVQSSIRTLLANNETDPVRFFSALNNMVYHNAQRMNVDKNLTLVLVDYQENQLYLSGQHEEMIIVRQGKLELIETMDLGFPIGLEENIADFVNQTTVPLNPDDVVVLYTDGITEAENLDGQMYKLERLCQIVQQNWQKTAHEIQQAVIEDVRQFIGKQKVFDDITLLVLKQK